MTTWMDLGGTGRPVVGRFVLPAGIKPGAIFPFFNQTLEWIRRSRLIPKPHAAARGVAHRVAETDEGEAYSRSARIFDTNVRPDGRFRIEDVPAGKYRFRPRYASRQWRPRTYGPS